MALLQFICSSVTESWVFFTLLCVLAVTYYFYKNYKLPPGPIGLPYVGYGPFLSNKARQLGEMSQKYNSDIISTRIYGELWIVLNSSEIVRELFQKRTDLMERLDEASFSLIDEGYGGVIGSYGRFWKEHRLFAISMLRDFGMGRIAAEEKIQEETRCLSQVFRSHKGKPFDPKNIINMCVSNVICSIALGKRCEYTDPVFRHSLESMDKMISQFAAQSHSRLILKMILFALPKWVVGFVFSRHVQALFTCYRGFADFSKQAIEEHKLSYDGNVNDLIDAYFKEIEKRKDEEDNVFSERQMECLITDLFVAGSETTYNSLRWAFLYLAAYPDIQQKVYEELHEAIGPHRMPTMGDKKHTPYTEAVLSEVQRLNTLALFGIPHTNRTEDVEVGGYIIPKMTPVVANLHHLHHDPKVWKNPDLFDPERFLEDGKVVNLDKMVQFSIGRRMCAGEALAKMELYIIFATCMKDFEIKLGTDDAVVDFEGYQGATNMPKPFEIRVFDRYPERAGAPDA